MTIGNKIADLRKEKSLTQKDLAEKLNVSDKVVSRWETGVTLPDVEMMKKLSKVFEVTIAELYDVLDEDDGNSDEKDNYERIWQYYDYDRIWRYKRSTIVACALFCIAALLACVILILVVTNAIPSIYPYTFYYALMSVLIALDVTIASVSIVLEIVGAVSLSSFSKTKYYRTMYEDALKKNIKIYGVLCAACIAAIIIVVALFLLGGF